MAEQFIQRSFIGGEIAPALRSRADLQRYSNSLARCENFIVKPQGGVYSRPGTKYIGELDDMTKVGRLIPFSFNTTQTYMLVFEHNLMRVIKDGGFVLAGAGPALFELVTTYTEAQLPRLSFVQDADVLTICHPDHDPKKLARTAHDVWTLTTINFAATVTTPTGLTITAYVGALVPIDPGTYRYKITAKDDEGNESDASAVASVTVGAGRATHLTVSWTAVSGAASYRVYKETTEGSGVYGWIADAGPAAVSLTDTGMTAVTSDPAPENQSAFAGSGNRPSAAGYFQQRAIYANTTNEPQKVFCSKVGLYESMRESTPSRDDDAIFFTLKAAQVNEIRHIVSSDSMILLTSSAEWKINEGQERVLTPTSISARVQSNWGSSWVAPAYAGESVLYVQEKGCRVRDLNFEMVDGKYQGSDLTVMAEHLFDGYEITEITYAMVPYGVLWCVRDDGVLLGMTYLKEYSLWAWHQHTTDGEFESVASIGEGSVDATYFIVKRTINGSTKRYVERMAERTVSSPTATWCVDCGLRYQGASATTITGLGHLEGKAVAVVADGNVVPGLTVVSGSITLPNASTDVLVGLPYTPAIEMLDLDVGSLQQTLRAKQMSISNVIIEVESSRGGWVAPILDNGDNGEFYEIAPREEIDNYDAIALRTFKQTVVIDPQWTSKAALRIEQRTPMPLAILSVIPDVDIS
jgi:hypothetical protein